MSAAECSASVQKTNIQGLMISNPYGIVDIRCFTSMIYKSFGVIRMQKFQEIDLYSRLFSWYYSFERIVTL